MDIIEMYEEREGELLTRLKEVPYTDPEYKTITENLKTISEQKDRQIKTENERHNNNEKNDIERRKVEVSEEQVKTDRIRIKVGVVSDVIDLGKCIGFSWVCYNGDKISYAIKDIKDVAKGFLRARRH